MPDVIVERSDRGMGAGIVVGIALVMLAVAVVLFFLFGGPGRFTAAPAAPAAPGAPGQTNVNVPAQNPPASAPNITVPRQIDVNINQPPAAQAPAQAPAEPAPPAGTR